MNNELMLAARSLAKGRTRHLSAHVGRSVECLSGSIWITQEGDRRDVVLGAGQAFAFDRHADALLSAFDDSRYVVLDVSAPAAH
jgi:hypothetical protein